jgi:Shugoshin C terminus
MQMEQMNLASRCREAISHVAMLKKELAQQQKRTADALAAQREQTQRMADSLTSSMELSRISTSNNHNNNEQRSRRVSPTNSSASQSPIDDGDTMDPEDVNMSRLISATPSPLRARAETAGSASSTTNVGAVPATPSPGSGDKDLANNLPTTRLLEEKRESPPPDSTPSISPKRELLPSMNVAVSVVEDTEAGTPSPDDESSSSDSDDEPTKDTKDSKGKTAFDHDGNRQQKLLPPPPHSKILQNDKSPTLYSTPKRSERSWAPKFQIPGDEDLGDKDIFSFSSSPQKIGGVSKFSYNDEEFPSDVINMNAATPSSVNGRSNLCLVNSIDDFEKSFSTDFPDSFTPKESEVTKLTSTKEIYNPFSATPERSNTHRMPRADGVSVDTIHDGAIGDALSPDDRRKIDVCRSSYVCRTPEEKKTYGPEDHAAMDSTPDTYETPPRDENVVARENAVDDPGRPEKTTSSAARARYERALQPRKKNDEQTQQPSSPQEQNPPMGAEDAHWNSSTRSDSEQELAALEQEIASNTPPSLSQIEAEVSPPRTTMSESILDIVDAYESPPSISDEQRRQEPPADIPITTRVEVDPCITHDKNNGVSVQSIASRLSNVRSLRRNVKKPISYAEPALNTKLRRGDKFFPKTSSPTSEDSERPGLVTPDGSPAQVLAIQ